jgi:hypothetical protein
MAERVQDLRDCPESGTAVGTPVGQDRWLEHRISCLGARQLLDQALAGPRDLAVSPPSSVPVSGRRPKAT